MEGTFIPLMMLGVSGVVGLCLWVSERGPKGTGRITDSWDDTRHRRRWRAHSAAAPEESENR